MKTLLALTAALMLSGFAHAQDPKGKPFQFNNWTVDGNSLIQDCGAFVAVINSGPPEEVPYDKTYKVGRCVGLVGGVATEMSENGWLNFDDSVAPPLSQLIRVVQKYLENNPDCLNSPASILVHNALLKAFPTARRCCQIKSQN